jgi:exosortase
MIHMKLAPPQARNWGMTAGLVALLLWCYWPILPGLFQQWLQDPDYSHAILVPLVSAFLLYQRRHRLSSMLPETGSGGLVLMGIAALLYAAGSLGAELFTQRLSLFVMLWGMVMYAAGHRFFRTALFPLLFLFLAVPLPGILLNSISFPLQRLAAGIATETLQLLAVPALRTGNTIHLASISLGVEEACSGIRSLLSMSALGLLCAYFLEKNWGPRILLSAAVVPIALIANVFRVSFTGILAHFVSPSAASGFFHGVGGLAVHLVALLGFLLFALLLRRCRRGFAEMSAG